MHLNPLGVVAIVCLILLLAMLVGGQDNPPENCPPTPQVTCCPPQTTSVSQTFPHGVTINVNIDPNGFTSEQIAAIETTYRNWQAAGSLANNGSGVRYVFTHNATPLSMTPPAGTYNIQVWHTAPPEAPGKAGGMELTLSNGRVVAQQVWINEGVTDTCAVAQTAAHETGHGFGLDHGDCANYTTVMTHADNGLNSATGTYGPTACDNAKVNQVGQYPKPSPTPTPTPGSCPRPPDCNIFWRWKPWPVCECIPSPIIVDISGDGIVLSAASDGVQFDLDVNGRAEWRAWTMAWSDDAWLALDRNDNGLIDSGGELFGDRTIQPIPPAGVEMNGFLALAEYDKQEYGGNGDGLITKDDRVFRTLRLWQDRNHNGRSELSELHKLNELGLQMIRLDYKESRRVDQYGNEFRFRAKVVDTQNAQLGRWAWDVFLTTQP